MGLGFGLDLGISLGHHHRVEHRISHDLNHELKLSHKWIDERWQLAEAFNETQYQERGQCPKCGHKLSRAEIIAGFTLDRVDIRTTCPKCGERFEARLIQQSRIGSTIEIPMFCPMQTLERLPLRDISRYTPEVLEKEMPEVYHSAKIHFGTLKAAYAREGIEYPHEEIIDWKEKSKPFLGNVPDSLIAEFAGVSRGAIGAYRRRLKIKSFRKSVSEGLLERLF